MGDVINLDNVSISPPPGTGSVGAKVFTQTLNDGDNTLNHALNATVTGIEVYDGTEQAPVSNWTITDANNVSIDMVGSIVNATIYVYVIP